MNASAVDGHVRRSFKNMLQIDSSLHGGNSGGPIIDSHGNVIGIVAAVAVDRSGGLFGGVRPLGDIGLILPISGAANLLAEVEAGQVKWNGELDFSLGSTLETIRETALAGRWVEARALAEKKLEESMQAELLTACGMLAVCTGDLPAAKLRFSQVVSMNPEDGQAKLMLFLIDWLSGSAAGNPHRQELLQADWRSPIEFEGYLARMLDGRVEIESGLEAWHNRREKSWLNFIAGTMTIGDSEAIDAGTLLRESVLAADTDTWSLYLSLARLERSFDNRRVALRADSERSPSGESTDRFRGLGDEAIQAMESREAQALPLRRKLSDHGLALEDRVALLETLRLVAPEDYYVRAALAYYHAANEEWLEAVENSREFLARPGRVTSVRMSLGLLELGILHHRGKKMEAEAGLEEYRSRVEDDLYRTIGDFLGGSIDADTIKARARERPEDLLIANTLMGFWAEGSADGERARADYKEALGSFLDDWLEYDFARERLRRLRQPENGP